jgi:transcriptional regulator GlxA family with amidase domain
MSVAAVQAPVFVVLPPRVLLLDVAGPLEVLRRANLEQDDVRFFVRYVGASAKVDSSIGLELSSLAPLPESLPRSAVVIVAGDTQSPLNGPGDPAADAAAQEAIVRWLKAKIRPGVILVGICSGALFAARAGLLDGYECVTHHACSDELRRLAPDARVLENRLFVEDRERLTSAGVTAGIDLMLHVVAKRIGAAAAQRIARYLVVYLRREGSDPQLSPWLAGRNHIHPAVHRAQDAMAAAPARSWSLPRLAKVAGTSQRHLSRLFNAHAGMSVTAYLNLLRLASAREMVGATRLDMESVAERAGFASTRQLRRVWRRSNETPPSVLRRRALAKGAPS